MRSSPTAKSTRQTKPPTTLREIDSVSETEKKHNDSHSNGPLCQLHLRGRLLANQVGIYSSQRGQTLTKLVCPSWKQKRKYHPSSQSPGSADANPKWKNPMIA